MAARGYAFGALGVAAFLAVAGAGYGLLVYPERAAHTAIDRAIATLPPGWTAHYGGLKYSLLKRQLVLTDVVLTHDTTRLSANQMTLTGPAGGAAPGAQFQSHEASMVGVTLHNATGDTTIRSIDAIELGGDFAEISQMSAKASPAEVMLALPHLLRLKRVAISDIQETAGPDSSGVARLVIEDLGRGIVGSIRAEDLHFAAQGTSLSVAKLALAGTDISALQGVFDPASYVAGQKPPSDSHQLVRSLDMTALDIKDPINQLHVDTMQLSTFRGRPFTLAPTAANRSDLRFTADVASALSLDNGTLHGVRIGNTPSGGAVVVRNFELNGYSGGRLAAAKLEGFELTTQQPQPIRAALSSLELRNSDLSRWLKLIVETGPAALTHSNGSIELPYAAATDLQMGAADSVQPMRLASFSMESTYENGQATASKELIAGLEIPLDGLKMPAPQAAAFRGMQISRLVINVTATSHWQPKEKRLLIDGFDFALDGLGTLDLSGSIAGFDPNGFTPETMAQTLQGLRFERAELHYHDASLVNRIIAMSAAQASVLPEQFRTKIIEQQEASATQLQQDTPEAAQALRQAIEFLRHPKTLAVTLAPPQPVGLAAIQTTPPAQLPKLLGLNVAAE